MTAQIIELPSRRSPAPTATVTRVSSYQKSYRQPPAGANLPRASASGVRIGDVVEVRNDRFRYQKGTVCEFDVSKYSGIVHMVRVDFGHIRAWLSPKDIRKAPPC